MDESKWPETENWLARFPAPLVDSEIALSAGTRGGVCGSMIGIVLS